MNARLLLAEAATGHPDGTISILRAGINVVWGEVPPVSLQGTLVTMVFADMGDMGQHGFDLRCMDADGEVINRVEGQFGVPQGGGNLNLILGFSVGFPRHGQFTFYLRIDNQVLDSWTVNVIPRPPQVRVAKEAS